jgi:hypothetical protein
MKPKEWTPSSLLLHCLPFENNIFSSDDFKPTVLFLEDEFILPPTPLLPFVLKELLNFN